MTLRAIARPVVRATTCDHGGPLLPTDPDDLDLVQHCELDAVVETPWPSEQVITTVALCSWHLARLLDAYPAFEPKLREVFIEQGEALDDYLPDPVLVRLEDAPETYEALNRTWYRLGMDQRGHYHYKSQAGGTVLVLDGSLDVEQVQALDSKTLESWFEFTRLVRGWAEIDPERVEFYPRGET